MKRGALWFSLAVALTACSSSEAINTPVLELTTVEPTTTAANQSDTESLPTTDAEETTATSPTDAPPSTSRADLEAELIAVIEGSNEVFYLDPIDPDSPLIDQYYEPELAETTRLSFVGRQERNESYFGQFARVSVDDIVVIDGTATVVECGIDAIGVVDAEGEVLVEPDEAALLRTYVLHQSANGAWRITSISFGLEEQQCDSW